MFDQLNQSLQSLVANLQSNLGIWYLIILNAFGVIAIFFKVSEPQLKTRKMIMTFTTIATTCWAMYFLFYGNATSCVCCLLGIVQCLVFAQRGKHKWADTPIWLFVFIALNLALGIMTFTSWKSIFPVIGSIFSVFTYYVLSEDKYRIFVFFYIACWLINSILNFYPIALANDAFTTTSAAIAIIRYNILGKKKATKTDIQEEYDKAHENN